MFPSFDGAGFDHYRAPTVKFLETHVTSILKISFSSMAPKYPTPHSIRVVALIWALRCHLTEWRSKKCGRWFGESNQCWSKYARSGETYVEKYYRKGKLDPVFKFWRYTDCF